MKRSFKNANEAFKYLYKRIRKDGADFAGTKALFDVGFYIENPTERSITSKKRKWSKKYAQAELEWYFSADPSIDKLGEIYGKIPPIWEKMAREDRTVNSNYGWQWFRNGQIAEVIYKLLNNKETRQAAVSIYDGKEIDKYEKDTPCTYAIQFTVVNDKLNMSVLMRSNDLWYGFCNDQYCFSYLQELIAALLDLEVGTYYHYAHNMHLYNNKL